jgi:hypothetical protein
MSVVCVLSGNCVFTLCDCVIDCNGVLGGLTELCILLTNIYFQLLNYMINVLVRIFNSLMYGCMSVYM